jgi:hypothetical protein
MLNLTRISRTAGKIRDLRRLNNAWFRGIFLRWRYFDQAFYRARYPEVAAAKMHPFLHYVLHGASEGRKPCAWFDPQYYLSLSKAAGNRGGDPFLDYLKHGRREGSSPHPLFDGKASAGHAMEGSLFRCGP